MNRKNRNSIASCLKLPQFITMNVIDGQAGLVRYYSLIFYSLTINNILNIIILLILAGVSIQAITNTGLFENAKKAKEKTMESQLKEEIDLAIQDIQVEEISKGNGVTLNTLANGQLESRLQDIECTLENNEITGEYKDYEYTINSNLEVVIEGPASGIRIKGAAEIQTTGYVFEGSTVEIKVTASITEGQITGIEAPEEATLKTDTSTTEKIYTVNKNGEYIFKITGENAKTKNIKVKVENILSTPQIKVDEIKKDGFKINIENSYPEGAITEYRYSVGGKVKKQGTTDKSYTITGLSEVTKYSNIKVIVYINSVSKESNVEEITTKKNEIEYSWDEIAEMAKAISNDISITDDSETATVNGKTLSVGQKKTLDGKTVRILGFNHDTLSESSTAYGSKTVTEKAGISFEYVDFLFAADMNNGSKNDGGWEKTVLRGILNGTTYDSLSIKDIIKKVRKDYIPIYNVATTQQTDDYLWLLSCGEIWDNGVEVGESRGLAKGTEGKQYKYYKINLKSKSYKSSNSVTEKPSDSNSNYWWLRSPHYAASTNFCIVKHTGECSSYPAATYTENVAPGFSI